MFKKLFSASPSPGAAHDYYGSLQNGSCTDRTESEQLSEFTPRKGDQGYAESDEEEASFSPRSPGRPLLALKPSCKVEAQKLFDACTVDKLNMANMGLITKVVVHQDEDLTEEDVSETLSQVGVSSTDLTWQEFYVWSHHVFGGLSEEDYIEAMAVLNTEIALIQKWSDLLSQSCEPDANGVILLDNFVQKVHELLPELSHADIEETVDNVDGTMGAKEVQYWVADMLGDCGQDDFEDMLKPLM